MRRDGAIERCGLVFTLVTAAACGSRGDPWPVDGGLVIVDGAAAADGSSGSPIPDGAAATDAPAPTDGATTTSSTPARLFPAGAVYYRDVSAVAPDPESAAMIAALAAAGGFGMGQLLIDFSFEVVTADLSAPLTPLVPGPDFSTPDCDQSPVPLMPGGALRGEAGYQCTQNGECHLLVVHQPTQRLYELWKANVAGGAVTAGCLAIWDLTRVYGPAGRGADCASADSAGLPITPLLFTADEVARGEIAHALRLSLPTDRIRGGVYLAPATHTTRSAAGVATAVPLGARLRLRPDFPVDTLPMGAQVVARALQRYGMILADGGPKALTARSDRTTVAKWPGLLGDHDLAALQVADFQVVDSGARIPYHGDCVRSP
jgi:hypothetical protein